MTFFPRSSGGFAPLFHLLDDYDVHRSQSPKCRVTPTRSFSPRFDVYEQNGSYHLEGELPGVDQDNVDIEFTDPHTLVIKGRAERQYNMASDANESADEPADDTSSNKSLQPTVEDEDEGESNDTVAHVSPASTLHPATTPKKSGPSFKYWASERSLGQFQRTFSFPTRVDQEAVRASLRNGILSVIVPKEAAPKLKKIRVE